MTSCPHSNRLNPAHTVRWVLCFSFFGAALTLAATSWAQVNDPAAARMLFQEARKAADAGDYANACPKFADSYKLDPAVGTLLNIADCEQHAGHIAVAWVTFQKALDLLSKGDDRRAMVEKASLVLEKRLPHLSIQLAATAPKDSVVERDGVPIGMSSLGLALPMDPGHHVVSVKAPGYLEQRYEFTLTEAETKNLQCEPGAAQAPSPAVPIAQPLIAAPAPVAATAAPTVAPVAAMSAPPVATEQPQPRTKSNLQTAAYVVGGMGIAGLVTGMITRVMALGQKSTIDGHCDSARACDATGMSAVDSARTLQTVSTVSLLVGLAGIGTGVYLVVAGAEKPVTQATLSPLLLPTGGGLSLQRNF